MDFNSLLMMKQAWGTFRNNHPKFPEFLRTVKKRGISEGTEVLISVTYPDGQNFKAGLKLKQSDIELLESLGQLM